MQANISYSTTVSKLAIKVGQYIFILLFPYFGYCQPPLPIVKPLYHYASYELRIDSSAGLTIADISSHHSSNQFKYLPITTAVTKNFNSAYWIKFKINIDPCCPALVLSSNSYFSEIDVYVFDSAGRYTSEKSGMKIPLKNRKFRHEQPNFLLPNLGYEQTCYIRFSSRLPGMGINIRLSEIATIYSEDINTKADYGIFFGIIIIISIYSFILFFKIGEQSYLYYALYVISFGLFACSEWGIMYRFIQESLFGPIAFINMYTLPYASMSIWLLCYTKSFLDTKIHSPFIHKVLSILIVVRIFLLVIGLFFALPDITSPLIESGLMLFAFWAGIIRWKQGYKPTRYFLVAMFVLFLGVLVHSTRSHIVWLHLPRYINQYGLYIAGIGEIILFSIALADRFKNLKLKSELALKNQIFQMEENEKLKDKVNRELEEKVSQRTTDLNLANNQLQQQRKEIERMNVLLHTDNLKLSDNVKKISQARVTHQKVSFEEFQAIYCDDEACYQYLEELKWKQGFTCKKCHNTKYSSGPTPYARRCSKCNHIERIFSDTIFSGIKFPIQKAFCFIFLLYHDKGITIDQLAVKLELGRQTAWAFRKKVYANAPQNTSDWSGAILQNNASNIHGELK